MAHNFEISQKQCPNTNKELLIFCRWIFPFFPPSIVLIIDFCSCASRYHCPVNMRLLVISSSLIYESFMSSIHRY